MFRENGPSFQNLLPSGWTAANTHARLWRLSGSVSSKLSIAVIVGLIAAPFVLRESAPAAAPVTASKVKTSDIAKPSSIVAARVTPPVIPPVVPPAEPAVVRQPAAPIAPATEAEPDAGLVELVATRRRAKQAKREEQQDDAKRTTSGIATEEPERRVSGIAAEQPAGKVPVAGSATEPQKQQEAEAEPKPDVWTEAEQIAALKECIRLLAPLGAEVETAPAMKHDQCGNPAPVMLRRIGSGSTKVEINPPAMVNCAMVAGLHEWVTKTLQPAAQETFGSPIARLRSASGYSCRNRNGSAFNSDKLSEHAKANAVDISGFVTADGRTIDVARQWGPTARDIREQERLAAQRAQEAKQATQARDAAKQSKAEPAKAEPSRTNSAIATKLTRQEQRDADRKKQQAAAQPEPPAKGKQGDGKSIPVPSAHEEDDARETREAAFLRRLHKGACGTFGTVLGPEANEAHRDHFHFDLAPRKRSAYCQ